MTSNPSSQEEKEKECNHDYSIHHGQFTSYSHEPTAITGSMRIFIVQECSKCHKVRKAYT